MLKQFVVCLLLISLASSRQIKISAAPQLDWCPLCVSFIDQSLNQLINILLNIGVVGGCADLCGYLPNQVEQVTCNLLCDYVGFEAFVKLIQDADPDPIWICEEIDVCPINDHSSGRVTACSVVPQKGQQGDSFTVDIAFTIVNATGTGEIIYEVEPPAGFPFGDGELLVRTQPGSYRISFSFQANPTDDDPFLPGIYPVGVALCEGNCGSTHSHARTLSECNTQFVLTQ
eukprot:TRINITY_DN11042_c0_g1_i1.p1 TRINITY_DN11042_c0_g1~~TRINITY_DN11042_c0_g1_i1.p1  ORF type:complete len:230 (+),score=45.36 TRINITY_DN11042_c0_g1_i1:86-775(+)